MTLKPSYIVFDYETGEVKPDGSTVASTEAYRREFRVFSCAFGWLDYFGNFASDYCKGEHAVGQYLERIAAERIPLVAHNIQFEKLVTKCRYPEIYPNLIWHADTMRLVQNYDNGGPDVFIQEQLYTDLDEMIMAMEEGEEVVKTVSLTGLGLAKASRRILNLDDHKKEAYEWIRANVPEWSRGKKEGQFLDRLPEDILERYNVADVEVTLKLYEHITKKFKLDKFDWSLDHSLFLGTVEYLVDAKIEGVLVERDRLLEYINEVREEFLTIGESFKKALQGPIKEVERARLLQRIRKLKTLKGRKKYVKRYKSGDRKVTEEIQFNVGSNTQLAALFVDTLGMVPKFKTDSGQPAFRSAVLSQWGTYGEMLLKRRKRLLVLKQAENLYELSSYDSRWHLDLRACGTSSGRFSGGQHG